MLWLKSLSIMKGHRGEKNEKRERIETAVLVILLNFQLVWIKFGMLLRHIGSMDFIPHPFHLKSFLKKWILAYIVILHN